MTCAVGSWIARVRRWGHALAVATPGVYFSLKTKTKKCVLNNRNEILVEKYKTKLTPRDFFLKMMINE